MVLFVDELLISSFCAFNWLTLWILSRNNKAQLRSCSASSILSFPNHSFKLVGFVSDLFVYPIKSCAGWLIDFAECTGLGLEEPNSGIADRRFMIAGCRENEYKYISLTTEPSMAKVSVSATKSKLRLSAPNMPDLYVPVDVLSTNPSTLECRMLSQSIKALDCGEKAAQWWSKYLKRDCRMLAAHEETDIRLLSKAKEGECCMDLLTDNDQVAFANWSPYMLTTLEALDDLNSRLQRPVSMLNFRPNIVVRGSGPFSEDNWDYICIGRDAIFRNVRKNNRCPATLVDPDTGIKDDSEPLASLRYRIDPGFHKSPIFGAKLVLRKPGSIKVGDCVWASLK